MKSHLGYFGEIGRVKARFAAKIHTCHEYLSIGLDVLHRIPCPFCAGMAEGRKDKLRVKQTTRVESENSQAISLNPETIRTIAERLTHNNRTLTQMVGGKEGTSKFIDEQRRIALDALHGKELPKRTPKQTDFFADNTKIYSPYLNYKKGDSRRYLALLKRKGKISPETWARRSNYLDEYCSKMNLRDYLLDRVRRNKMKEEEVEKELLWYAQHEHEVGGARRSALLSTSKPRQSLEIPDPEPVQPDEILEGNWHPNAKISAIDPMVAMHQTLGGRHNDDGDDQLDPNYANENTTASIEEASEGDGEDAETHKKRKKGSSRMENSKKSRNISESLPDEEEGDYALVSCVPEKPFKQRNLTLLENLVGNLNEVFAGNSIIALVPHVTHNWVHVRFIKDQDQMDQLPECSATFQRICRELTNPCEVGNYFVVESMFFGQTFHTISNRLSIADLLTVENCKSVQQAVDTELVMNQILPALMSDTMQAYPCTRDAFTKISSIMMTRPEFRNFIRERGHKKSDFAQEQDRAKEVKKYMTNKDSVVSMFELSFTANGMNAITRTERNKQANILSVLKHLDGNTLKKLQDAEITALHNKLAEHFFEDPGYEWPGGPVLDIAWADLAISEYGEDTVDIPGLIDKCKAARKVYDSLQNDSRTTLQNFQRDHKVTIQEFLDSLPECIATKIEPETIQEPDKDARPAAKEPLSTLLTSLEKLPIKSLACNDLVKKVIEIISDSPQTSAKVTKVLSDRQKQIVEALHRSHVVTLDDVVAKFVKNQRDDTRKIPGLSEAIVSLNHMVKHMFSERVSALSTSSEKAECNANDILIRIVGASLQQLSSRNSSDGGYHVEPVNCISFVVNSKYIHDLGCQIDVVGTTQKVTFFLSNVCCDPLVKAHRFTLKAISTEVYWKTAQMIIEHVQEDDDMKDALDPIPVADMVHTALWLIAKNAGKENLSRLYKDGTCNVLGKLASTEDVIVIDDDDKPRRSDRKTHASVSGEERSTKETASAPQSSKDAQTGSAAFGEPDLIEPEKGQSKIKPRNLNDANKQVLVPIFMEKLKKYLADNSASMLPDWDQIIKHEFTQALGRPQSKIRLPASASIFSSDDGRRTIEDVVNIMTLPSVESQYYSTFKASLDFNNPRMQILSFVIQVAVKIYREKKLLDTMPHCLKFKPFQKSLRFK